MMLRLVKWMSSNERWNGYCALTCKTFFCLFFFFVLKSFLRKTKFVLLLEEKFVSVKRMPYIQESLNCRIS